MFKNINQINNSDRPKLNTFFPWQNTLYYKNTLSFIKLQNFKKKSQKTSTKETHKILQKLKSF